MKIETTTGIVLWETKLPPSKEQTNRFLLIPHEKINAGQIMLRHFDKNSQEITSYSLTIQTTAP